jgi:hypothetical protein
MTTRKEGALSGRELKYRLRTIITTCAMNQERHQPPPAYVERFRADSQVR